LRFASTTAVANQPPDFERFSIIPTVRVRTIQGLPVHASLLDRNMTFIEDAKLPSNIGKLITEVKGHYRKLLS
jgi:hypothetical protein